MVRRGPLLQAATDMETTQEVDPYLSAFRGGFVGVLRWPQMETLWERVGADAGGRWYIYAIGEAPPSRPADAEAVKRFLHEVDRLLRRDHEEDYCGVVYADDLGKPSFIKIYDPNNLGVVCGASDNPPLPGWTLSKLKPIDLPGVLTQVGNRRRWWRRLFG